MTNNFSVKEIIEIKHIVSWLEHLNHNPGVGGSSPFSATNNPLNNKPLIVDIILHKTCIMTYLFLVW